MSKFTITLIEIQRALNADSRLSRFRTIWCQGSIKNSANLVITTFTIAGLRTQTFIDFKNFVNFKGDAENPAYKNQLEYIIGLLP